MFLGFRRKGGAKLARVVSSWESFVELVELVETCGGRFVRKCGVEGRVVRRTFWKWQMLMSGRNIQGDPTLLKPMRSMDDVWL